MALYSVMDSKKRGGWWLAPLFDFLLPLRGGP